MSAYVMDSALFRDQFSTQVTRDIFDDRMTVQRWLDVEAALARVQADLGIIPEAAATEIVRVCDVSLFDLAALKAEMDRTAHPIVPLLRQIKTLCDGDAGEFVHWGATTQDIMDTGVVLQVRDALDAIQSDTAEVLDHALALARRYRSTPMVARSHGQHALPITFGFKVAQWASELRRNLTRLDELRARMLVLQFSGAVGTLAALEPHGDAVQRGLAKELRLDLPDITWHTSRDRMAELMCTLTLSTCTIGRIAHEIYALQKTEFAELEEPFSPGKVGSSTMPHKRNPPACETVVALSKALRSIVPAALEATLVEHERDKIGLQLEREFTARGCAMAHAAAHKMKAILSGLTVREVNMERNLWIQKGLLMSEPVMMALSDRLGRQEAHEIVYEICMKVFEEDGSLRDGLAAHPEIGGKISEEDLDRLFDPHRYLGMAEVFVDRVSGQQFTAAAE